MGGGKERTAEEFKSMLEMSGLVMENVIPADGGISVIEAIPN